MNAKARVSCRAKKYNSARNLMASVITATYWTIIQIYFSAKIHTEYSCCILCESLQRIRGLGSTSLSICGLTHTQLGLRNCRSERVNGSFNNTHGAAVQHNKAYLANLSHLGLNSCHLQSFGGFGGMLWMFKVHKSISYKRHDSFCDNTIGMISITRGY